jgi:hypothetical protein
MISGLITIHHSWRMIYWVSVILIGASTILVIFTFPETLYNRSDAIPAQINTLDQSTSKNDDVENPTPDGTAGNTAAAQPVARKRSFISSLQVFAGSYTDESYFTLFVRPIVLLSLPTVLWATLVAAGTIGFLVAISSNFAPAFEQTYGFKEWQCGLCFISALVGSFIGIFAGGHLSDAVADIFTKRNGGIREPEMRLPAISISVITAPLALVLYGVGISNKLHWICPTIGLGLRM